MKVAITGSTGLIASHLIPLLQSKGHIIHPITRSLLSPENNDQLSILLNECDAIINLAGNTINQRWNKKNKAEIIKSRVKTTHILVETIKAIENKPKVLLSASAVGIYPNGASCDESWTHYGNDFLANVCKVWENEAKETPRSTRVVLMRFGVVLDQNGGAFPKIATPFRLGIGGKIGTGNQGFSWIHITDAINAILFLLENENEQGVFNLTAPDSCTNYHLSKKISKIMKCPSLIAVPAFFLKLALGEQSELVTKGQFAQPKRLTQAGYHFEYPSLEEALTDLLAKR